MCYKTIQNMALCLSALCLFTLSVASCTDSKCECLEAEPGIEHGVSAAFGGVSGNVVVRAGGCNFPDNPLGADSKKRYYRGIYVLNPSEPDGEWKRVGSLPECMAYGASATTPDGVVMVGGSMENGCSTMARIVSIAGDGKLCMDSLPELPFTLDNTAACADGNKVYVCGGNLDGQPSNVLLCLNLDCTNDGWKRLADFPGNSRVQPVVAATGGKVYVWGGFAPKGENREATLDTDGYCYDPEEDIWQPVAGPTDAEGDAVSLGGGIAVTLADGRIAAAGGVNRHIFLAALQSQPADYLQHPASWYRFNPTVYIFDPQSCKWSIAATSDEYARAGAAAALCGDSLILLGGELKPRIRTPKTSVVKLDVE